MTFNIPDYTYKIKELIKVIDGDTIDVLIDVGFYLTARKRIRFLDMDTDELHGGTDETKLRARMARERLIELLSMGELYIKTEMDETGKYGRLLGRLYAVVDGSVIDINATMVNEGYQKGNPGTIFTEDLQKFPL